jgi:ferredoxin-NADP reductase
LSAHNDFLVNYRTELVSAATIAEDTMAFHFRKPDGFSFEAGQYVDMTLASGETYSFSIVAAPHEDELVFATRMRGSDFKQKLKDAPSGYEVALAGPLGSFILHENPRRAAIFLIGGIGITPVMSIVKDAAYRKLPHELFLFYSDRYPARMPFLAELFALAAQNPRFHFIPTMTDVGKHDDSWDGERGYITFDMIERHAPEYEAIYYISGREAMVASLRNLLATAGVSRDDVRFEEFAGY